MYAADAAAWRILVMGVTKFDKLRCLSNYVQPIQQGPFVFKRGTVFLEGCVHSCAACARHLYGTPTYVVCSMCSTFSWLLPICTQR